MIIISGQKTPFLVQAASNSLFIGMRVFNITTGSPVQITGQAGQTNGVYPMANIADTLTYLAFFSGLIGQKYAFVFDSYTDGTYVTISGSYTEYSLSAVCAYVTPVIVNGLQIDIGCQDQPTQSPVVVSQASDLNLLLSFFDEGGSPLDVTQATALSLSILESDGTTILLKSLGGAITLVSGIPNQAIVQLLAADIATLAPGDNDAQVKISLNGTNFAVNVYSALSVEAPAV